MTNGDKSHYYDALFLERSKNIEQGNNEASTAFFFEQAIPKDATIVEVGGNIGTFAHTLFKTGYRKITSLEIAPSPNTFGKRTYPEIADRLVLYDGKTFPFEDQSVDVVVSFDVVEHIPDVDRHFQEVRRILKNDGRYLFQTPNKITNVPWEIVRWKSFTSWRDYHCSVHTYAQLQDRLTQNGFIGTISKRPINTAYNKEKIRKKLGPIGPILIALFDKAPLPLTPNFWVIAHKKNS